MQHSPLTLKLQEITERHSALMRQAFEPYGQVMEAARQQIERSTERLAELNVNAQAVDPRAAVNPWGRNEAAELREGIVRLEAVIEQADTEYTFIKHNIRLAQDAEMDALGLEMQNPDHPWYHEYRHRMFPHLYPMGGSGKPDKNAATATREQGYEVSNGLLRIHQRLKDITTRIVDARDADRLPMSDELKRLLLRAENSTRRVDQDKIMFDGITGIDDDAFRANFPLDQYESWRQSMQDAESDAADIEALVMAEIGRLQRVHGDVQMEGSGHPGKSRGDEWHRGQNRMRGGSTILERGFAAEVRELHPLANRDERGADSRSGKFNLLLNQVVHDKTTTPFDKDAMRFIKSTVRNNRLEDFGRAPAVPAELLEDNEENNKRVRALLPGIRSPQKAQRIAEGSAPIPAASDKADEPPQDENHNPLAGRGRGDQWRSAQNRRHAVRSFR